MRNHFLRAAAGNVASGSSATTFMPLGTSDMTYEIWLYKNNLTNTTMGAFGLNKILSNGNVRTNFAHTYFLSTFIGNYLSFQKTASASGGTESITSQANYNLASWNHLVISHDISAGIPKLYYNASERSVSNYGSWTAYYNNSDDQYKLYVGSNAFNKFYGRISILRIYKGKAFTSSEVTQNYNAEKGRYTSSSSSGTHVTSNLVFHIDAGNTNSYSGSGATTVNSLVGGISSSSYNQNISYSSSDGGYWSFGSNTGDGIEFDSI